MANQTIHPGEWLPHSGPMLMLSELIYHDVQSIRCNSIIQADNPLLVQAKFPVLGAVELFAQAAGLLFGLRKADSALESDKRPGAVIQIKSFALQAADISVGDVLDISAEYIGGSQDAVMMKGEVRFQKHKLFEGSLMIALFNAEKV